MMDKDLYMLTEKFQILMSINEEDKKRFKGIVSWAGQMMELSVKERMCKGIFPKRGEVWTCNFGENVGSEINGIRPALILQLDQGNLYGNTTIVAPITNREERLPTQVTIHSDDVLYVETELSGTVVLEQIRLVSKARLGRKIANLSDSAMSRVEKALLLALGYSEDMFTMLEMIKEEQERLQVMASKSA
ncbi:type II toxin-antitoxin system PemK/MazF family toxin [Brevibacillus sp. NPDC058079]|uniref:type II toxin-antitoxin system PemK/MazF family toxin n=1 Tax=Brevibacillus sp. NPDC058079 TaxID=3346330 RepID=UPI0036F16A10